MPETLAAPGSMVANFDLACRAGFVWLKFDADAGVAGGLPIRSDTEAAA